MAETLRGPSGRYKEVEVELSGKTEVGRLQLSNLFLAM